MKRERFEAEADAERKYVLFAVERTSNKKTQDTFIHFELSATSPPKKRWICDFELCPEGS